MTYFLTALGCGIAGYKVSEIAPLFRGMSSNIIFPESFKPYIEENAVSLFPNLTSRMVQAFITDEVIFTSIMAVNPSKMHYKNIIK